MKDINNFAVSSTDLSLPYADYLNTPHPTMSLQQEVGGAGIDCEVFARTLFTIDELASKNGYQDITILINTPGGDVNKGMGICDAILRVKMPVDTFIINAKSMGACIAMQGREVTMADYGQMMIHEASFGDPDMDEERKKEIELANQTCAKLLSARRGLNEDKIRKLMARETWINADDALQLGLIDKIEKSEKLNNTARFAGTIVNSAIKNEQLKKKAIA